MRYFMLSLLCLLIATPSLAAPSAGFKLGNVESSFAIGSILNPYNVIDYGATADFVTDDAHAFTAAVDAACASSGPRFIYIPAGQYRLGENTLVESQRVWSGMQVQCGDIEIFGDGDATKLYPNHPEGNYPISVCSEFSASGGSAACSLGRLENVTIRDLMIIDDDPKTHGHKCVEVDEGTMTCDNPPCSSTGETPRWGDTVEWDATVSFGTVQYHEDGVICIVVGNGTLDANDDLNGLLDQSGGAVEWLATDVATVSNEGISNEESHGIFVKKVDNLTISRVSTRDISDEAIDLKDVTNFLLEDLDMRGCSQVNAGGSCINFGNNTRDGLVLGGFFEGGRASVSGGGGLIQWETVAGSPGDDVRNINVVGAILSEDCTNNDEGECVEGGFIFAANSQDILDINISSSQVLTGNGYTVAMLGGGSALTTVKVSNSDFYGPVDMPLFSIVSFTDTDVTNTVAGSYGFVGITNIIGGEWNAPNATVAGLRMQLHGRISGAYFGPTGSGAYCIILDSGAAYVTVSGNRFQTCGASASAHAVFMGSTNTGSVVGNTYEGNTAGSGFSVGNGTVTQGPGCIVGNGSKANCGYNALQN